MNGLPSGTVTLLFSDVEGSTRLLLKSQSEYSTALDLERNVLRRAWQANRGVEMGTEGDSFMVVFASALDAVAAAVSGQRELHGMEWPRQEPMRVRMGIHTGTPMRHADGYIGMDVHVAARVAAAANGGQVLVSESTASLVRGHGVFELRDLGRHQLKDLPRPEHLFQLLATGLPEVTRAIRSLGSTSNLPTRSTPLVGRAQELADILGFLRRPDGRLVTLTGPGGTGKTRLAVAVASEAAAKHERSVYFISLEGVTRADDMWAAIAAVLDVPDERRAVPMLLEHVQREAALLILDNLEQVEGAPAVVAELMTEAPEILVIATSRHPLHVEDEQEYPVPPLAVPESAEDDTAASVELLVSCIRRFRPSFAVTAANRAAITAICGRLDGLPLALEIASARLRMMSPQSLLQNVDQVLDLRSPAHGRPSRHQTLRNAIAWSHDLLTKDARRLFRCLGVFGGEADLAAVEWVWARVDRAETDVLYVLEQLVDASLVSVEDGPDSQPRIQLLNTVSAFAEDQLRGSADYGAAYEAAAEFYDELSLRLSRDRLPGWRPRLVDGLEIEQHGYRRCLDWLLDNLTGGNSAREHRLAMALQMTFRLHLGLLRQRSRFEESSRLLEQVLEAAGPRTGLRVGACLAATAHIAFVRNDVERAEQRIRAASVSARDTETDADLDRVEAETMSYLIDDVLGQHLRKSGQMAESRALAERWVERAEGPSLKFAAVIDLAATAHEEGQFEESVVLHRQAAALAAIAGDEAFAAIARANAACALRMMGRPEDADREYRDIWQTLLATRDPTTEAELGEDYAAVLIELGRCEEAALVMGAAGATRERFDLPQGGLQEAELSGAVSAARLELGPRWDVLLDEGRALRVEDLMRRAVRTDSK